MKPLAICYNKKIFDHSTMWTKRFIEYCKQNNIPYDIVDCYSSDVISKLPNYNALLWHYNNYVISDMLEARNILQAANLLGLIIFPSLSMNWHFDDKIAEMYALEAVDAPIPRSWVFYTLDDCSKWLENEAQYPLVAKLRCGSGSNNVKLLQDKDEALRYAKRMFSKGYNPSPSLAYKAYSKIQSSHNIATAIKRAKKIPEFLSTRKHASMMPIEKGYCYFQEFIPNDGYDLKVVVIGEKLTFCARSTRRNDFRASGGGDIFYDRALLSDEIIETAFKAAARLNMNCVGFDFVVDNTTMNAKIVEMCYGFDYEAQSNLAAYVDRMHVWHEEPIFVPDEIIKMVMKEIESR